MPPAARRARACSGRGGGFGGCGGFGVTAAVACAGWATSARGQPQPAESPQGPYGVIPEDYNPEEPPSLNNTVLISLRLTKLHSVDANTNIVTVTADVLQYWLDQRLSPGRQPVAVNPAEIWTPDADLMEKVDNFQESCSTTRALLLSDEYVARLPDNITRYNLFWTQSCVLPVKCHILMDRFPFDTHKCTMTLVPWTDPSYVLAPANMSAANLITQEFETILDTHKEIINVPLQMPGGADISSTGVRFHVYISRYSRYYMLNLVSPTVLMVVLSWFVFFTPISKSDRLAYSVTLLLAAMAVQFITADKRPAEACDGWIDKFMTWAYILIILPIVETSVLYRMEVLIEHRVDHCEIDGEGSSPERTKIMARGHARIRMIDRIARVVYPILITLCGIFLFGPGSPVFEPRHEEQAELSVSFVTLVVFSVPLFAVMFWFSLKSWISLGPHTMSQLTGACQEVLADPDQPDDRDTEEASKDSDDEFTTQSARTYINRGPPWAVVH